MKPQRIVRKNPFNQGYFLSNELKGMGFKFVGQDV
jgi:hypothetical protein